MDKRTVNLRPDLTPAVMYIRSDDRESAHVFYTRQRRTRIDWTPVIVVIVLALAALAALAIFGILP